MQEIQDKKDSIHSLYHSYFCPKRRFKFRTFKYNDDDLHFSKKKKSLRPGVKDLFLMVENVLFNFFFTFVDQGCLELGCAQSEKEVLEATAFLCLLHTFGLVDGAHSPGKCKRTTGSEQADSSFTDT